MNGLVDKSLLLEFLADSREHLGLVEPDLLAMETGEGPVDPEAVNRVFRAIHSIKGFSVFLGLEPFTDLSHSMESALTNLREGRLTVTPHLVDALLAGVDRLGVMLDQIEASEPVSPGPERKALDAFLEGREEAGTPDSAADPFNGDREVRVGKGPALLRVEDGPGEERVVFGVEPGDLEKALEAEHSFFALWVDRDRDLAAFLGGLSRLTGVLAQDLTDESAPPGPAHCLIHTIIEEPEIAAAAAEVDPLNLRPLTREAVEAVLAGVAAESVEKTSAPEPVSGNEAAGDPGISPAGDPGEGSGRENYYALCLDPREDLGKKGRDMEQFRADLESVAKPLWIDWDGSGEPSGPVNCLAVTSLDDPEMLSVALEIAPERIRRLEPGEAQEALARAAGNKTVFQPPARTSAKAPAKTPARERGNVQPAAPAPVTTPAAAAQIRAPGDRGGPDTVRVGVGLVDSLINLAGELVLGRNQLKRLMEISPGVANSMARIMQTVDHVTSDLQEHIMRLRMQPVGNLLNKLPRIVRDLARQLGKEVELSIKGAEVELDKTILESLSDPLTHLIRNALDHGLEPPETREALGKPRAGSITVRAFHEDGQVNLLVEDDGRGIDPDGVAQKAVSLGIVSAEEARTLPVTQKLMLITTPGFSTAGEVTDVSGRGVGMDVVQSNLERVAGRLEIDSRLGEGTSLRLRLPLTLAIIPCLVVGAEGHIFAIPQVDVQELVSLKANEVVNRVEEVGGAPVLRLRERLLPLTRLTDVLGIKRRFLHPDTGQWLPDKRRRLGDRRSGPREPGLLSPEEQADLEARLARDRRRRKAGDSNVVVLKAGASRYGLVVDELFDTEEIVVKSLSRHIRECRCFSGTTIMGDGRVAMILDSSGLAETAGLSFAEVQAEEDRWRLEREKRERENAAPSMEAVLFTLAEGQQFAVPLVQVARLETFRVSEMEMLAGRPAVQYRGGGLPLLFLDTQLPVGSAPREQDELYLIIPRGEPPTAGVVASSILDVTEVAADIRPYQGVRRGLMGVAPVRGRLTLFLDLGDLLTAFQTSPAGHLEGSVG